MQPWTVGPVDTMYCGVGSSVPSYRPVTVPELAAHVVADWLPGRPPAMSAAITEMLHEVFEKVDLWKRSLLATRESVNDYERQWRIFISWMVGMAMSRKVASDAGYTYIAPVSLFRHPHSPHFGWWSQFLPARRCAVRKPNPPLSNLMPDYVLARVPRKPSDCRVSFLESKGTTRCLLRRDLSPKCWIQQAHNAVFLFDGKEVEAERHLLVATRIQPRGVRDSTRLVYVRSWNSRNVGTSFPFAGAREVLQAHYMCVCAGLGLRHHAHLLALSRRGEDGGDMPFVQGWGPLDPSRVKGEFERELDSEIERMHVPDLPDLPVVMAVGRESVRYGDSRTQVGLAEPVVRLVRALAADDDELVWDALNEARAATSEVSTAVGGRSDAYVRDDGVIATVA